MRQGFTYSEASAARADDSRTYIKTTGAYALMIAQCSVRETPNGAEMIDFVLKNENTGEIALTNICTLDKQGNPAFGADIFNAMLTILGITGGVTYEPAPVCDVFGEKKDGWRIRAVEKKPIGVLLQYVERVNQYGEVILRQNGEPKYNMVIRCVFHPQTRQTVSELLKNLPATRLEREIPKWKDSFGKPPQEHPDEFESAPRTRPAQAPAPAAAPNSPASVQDDEWIPF